MCRGERVGAHLAIGAQPGGVDTVEVRRRFEILELPDVEIAFSRRSPAQKYVARMLDESLSAHDAFAAVGIDARLQMLCQHRFARFFNLKQQRIVIVGREQRDAAARPDASDADDFDRVVDKVIARIQVRDVVRKRGRVSVENRLDIEAGAVRLLGVEEPRGIVAETPRAADYLGELIDDAANGLRRGMFDDARTAAPDVGLGGGIENSRGIDP